MVISGLGRFWGRLGRTAAEKVARFNGNHGFGNKNGAKRKPQGSHFGIKNLCKIALNFEGAPGMDFRSPREGSEVKNHGFT